MNKNALLLSILLIFILQLGFILAIQQKQELTFEDYSNTSYLFNYTGGAQTIVSCGGSCLAGSSYWLKDFSPYTYYSAINLSNVGWNAENVNVTFYVSTPDNTAFILFSDGTGLGGSKTETGLQYDMYGTTYYNIYSNFTNMGQKGGWFTVLLNYSSHEASWYKGNTFVAKVYFVNFLANLSEIILSSSSSVTPLYIDNITITQDVIIDFITPTVTVQNINNSYTIENFYDIIFNATDDTNPLNCSVYVNGTRNTSNSSVTINITSGLRITGLELGNISYYVACSDSSGKLGVSAIYNTVKTLNIPTINIDEGIINNTQIWNNTYTVIFNVTDNNYTSLPLCTIYLNGNLMTSLTPVANNTRTTYQFTTGIVNGTNTWYVKCYNDQNNNRSALWNFIEVYPTLTIYSPVDNYISKNFLSTIFNYTDINSEIMCGLNVNGIEVNNLNISGSSSINATYPGSDNWTVTTTIGSGTNLSDTYPTGIIDIKNWFDNDILTWGRTNTGYVETYVNSNVTIPNTNLSINLETRFSCSNVIPGMNISFYCYNNLNTWVLIDSGKNCTLGAIVQISSFLIPSYCIDNRKIILSTRTYDPTSVNGIYVTDQKITNNSDNVYELYYTPPTSGNYTWNISCNSSSGITTQSNDRAFIYDIIKPTITNFTTNATTSTPQPGQEINLQTTATDNYYLQNCSLWTNKTGAYTIETTFNLGGVSDSYNMNYNFVVPMTYSNVFIGWRVDCTDVAGNTNQSEVNMFKVYDVVLPNITLGSANNFNISGLTVMSSKLYNLSLSVLYNDSNLFASQTVVNCSVDGVLYDFTQIDYNTTTAWINATVNIYNMQPQRCQVDLMSADDHTAFIIPEYQNKKVKNGLEFTTDVGTKVEIKSKDRKVESSDIDQLPDRQIFNFNFSNNDSSITFVITSDKKLYYRQNSEYPGHFVTWDLESRTGTWIDFDSLSKDNYNYVITKITDYEYNVEISTIDGQPINDISFQSIGGTNTYNISYTFYIGSYVNISSYNKFDGNTLDNYSVNITSDAYPSYDGLYNISGKTGTIENLSAGNYTFTFLKPETFIQMQTAVLNVTNISLLYNTSESELYVNVYNIVSGSSIISNHSLLAKNKSIVTTMLNSASTIFYQNASSFELNVSASRYYDYNLNFSLTYRQNRTIDVFLGYVWIVLLKDERTQGIFDINSTNETTFMVFCVNSTDYYVLNTTTYTLPITCNYTKFRFTVTYGTSTYYRTFLTLPPDSLVNNIYLIDRLTTSAIYNNFIIQDLFNKYVNTRVIIKKIIGSELVDITGDYIDVENQVGAYLIENNEYQIWIYSDNNPPFLKGLYNSDVAGDKYITLGSFSPEQESQGSSLNKDVKYYVYMTNDSQNSTFINVFYNDSSNLTTSIQWSIIEFTTGAVVYNTLILNTSMFSSQLNITPYINNSNTNQLLITYNGKVYTVKQKFGNTLVQLSKDIFKYVSETWMNWLILLLICTLAIMGTVKTGNILNLVICGAAAVFVYVFRWWQLSAGILILCAILTLISFLKSREKEAYYV